MNKVDILHENKRDTMSLARRPNPKRYELCKNGEEVYVPQEEDFGTFLNLLVVAQHLGLFRRNGL